MEENSINITINGWCFGIELNNSDDVIEESLELAEKLVFDHELHDKIKSCKKRLELSGDPDFDMYYFNNFCLILENIESFKDVFTFNPQEGFLNIL